MQVTDTTREGSYLARCAQYQTKYQNATLYYGYMTMRTIYASLFFVALSLLAGFLGSFATMPAIDGWYSTLTRPSWTPPNEVFGPVWTTLYVLMGIAAGLVWSSRMLGRVFAIWLFVAHLVVNTLWSIVFFGLQEPGAALIIIAVLWLVIVAMMRVFSRFSRVAAYLLVPYLLWVTYASTLNAGIVFLN